MDEIDDRVGIRELRQYLTRYIERVKAGETLRVTDRGRAVALLTPLPERATALDRLVAAGRVARARLDLAELGEPPDGPMDNRMSRALARQRAND